MPEDVLIWEKARKLAVQSLAHQAEEQEREDRRQEFTAKAAQAAFTGPAVFTHNNMPHLHPQQCEKSAHNPFFLIATAYPERDRTIPDQQAGDVGSLRSTHTAPPFEKALVGGEAASALKQQQAHSEAGQEPRRATVASETSETAQPAPTAFEQALSASEEEVGALLVEVLRQYGDADSVGGMGTILVALIDAGAPVERLRALVELGQHRLLRWEEKGGHIRRPQAYYIGVMQRLAREAKARGWEVAAMEAQDQVKHADILRQRAMRRMGQRRQYLEPEPHTAAAEEMAPALETAEVSETAEGETVAAPPALGWTDVDSRATPTPEAVEGRPQEVAWAEAQGCEREAAAALPT